jgi:hypothetical protein
MIKYLKCKFGILLDRKDLKISLPPIIKMLPAFYSSTPSLILSHSKAFKSG